MRATLLMTAALVAAGVSAPVLAQSNTQVRPGHVPGVGNSEPSSSNASNIDKGDSRSAIAPRLPTPQGATPDQYLHDAEQALGQHKTGLAQEAMERAETGMLDRSVPQDQTSTPDQDPRVGTVRQALDALGHGDAGTARKLVGQALAMNASAGTPSMPPAIEQGARRGDHLRPQTQGTRQGVPNPQLGTHSYEPGGAGDAGSSGSTE